MGRGSRGKGAEKTKNVTRLQKGITITEHCTYTVLKDLQESKTRSLIEQLCNYKTVHLFTLAHTCNRTQESRKEVCTESRNNTCLEQGQFTSLFLTLITSAGGAALQPSHKFINISSVSVIQKETKVFERACRKLPSF